MEALKCDVDFSNSHVWVIAKIEMQIDSIARSFPAALGIPKQKPIPNSHISLRDII